MVATMSIRDAADLYAPIVLASASPRRRNLLQLLHIRFSVCAADVDENPLPGEGPEALTSRLARSKALAVAANGSARAPMEEFSDVSRSGKGSHRDDSPELSADPCPAGTGQPVVLGADTVVVLDGAILGKPADDAEATAMLAALRGRSHRVLTGVALAVAGEIAWSGVVETTVWMRQYGADEVERYVRSGSPLDKAGAYGIQDTDFRPVERIDGCLTNVVGLPLCEVGRALLALDPERSRGRDWTAEVADGDAGSGPIRSARDCSLCERARHL